MRFSNIVLVIDTRHPDQAQTLRRAAMFARTQDAILTVCEVVDWVVPEVPRYMTASTARILTDSILTNKIERLKELIETNDVSDLDIAVNVLIGKPHIEVARMVRENRHDLVIKPFTERAVVRFFSALQEDRELIRSCPCPVWLVNVADHGDNKCILAALDMPTEDDLKVGLNQHIVEISRSIAFAESRLLHFVHAWNLRGESHMRGNPATDLEADRMLAREATRRKTWLHKTVATPRSEMCRSATEKVTPELHVLPGQARRIVPALAEKLGAGLIVMGTAARIPGILRRSTAEIILPRSECSMLIVKQPESVPTRASEAKRTLRVR